MKKRNLSQQTADTLYEMVADGVLASGEEEFIQDMKSSFQHKFASKPQVIEGNMRALKRSLEEVRVG